MTRDGRHVASRLKNTRSRARRGMAFAGIALFILGCGVFLYPTFGGILAQQAATETINQAFSANSTSSSDAEANGRSKDGDQAYEYLLQYNKSVEDGTAGPINDPWGIGSDQSVLNSIGLKDGILGSITIDRLDETIPLYLGANSSILSKGAGIIAGTSVPLGEKGSNSVIAAHRAAVSGLPMFRDIEDIQIGDSVVIKTPWDTFTYRAVETKVISPSDIDALLPQKSRDLITLFTCHPYPYNYQRYLVYCERVEGDSAYGDSYGASIATKPDNLLGLINQAMLPSQSAGLTVERWTRIAGLLVLIAVFVAGVVSLIGRLIERVKRQKTKESYS